MDLREMIAKGAFFVFDGGMGTMLQARGLGAGECPEDWNIKRPEDITAVHTAYLEAGADIITTNTFGANSRKYARPVEEVIKAAIGNARRAIEKTGGCHYVAQDIGPIGTILKPLGELDFDDAYELFKEQVTAGAKAGADLFIIETMTDLLELKAAVLAVKENSDLPVIASMSFEKSGRTFLGTEAGAFAVTMSALKVDALGINCSLGPDELKEIVETVCRYSTVPVILQANAGLPKIIDDRTVFTVGPGEYVHGLKAIIENTKATGVDKLRIFGGCCGTTPEHIRAVRAMLDNPASAPIEHNPEAFRAMVCSNAKIVNYDNRTAVVGERLNPTGKKKISAALREENYDLLVAEAQTEADCGAQILDVNAGLPDIDEKRILVNLVNELTGAVELPLQLDTTDEEALEAAVRRYPGKPVINSVNGKAESLRSVLPIAAKYGAALICLTLDEQGIPSKAEDRIAIAERIMQEACKYGIPKTNLIVDGLVMTVSTNQPEAFETLKTVGLARSRLGLHTCLGVSNISFGLPNREVVNATFLAAAFTSGLNLAIIDPTKERYMQTVAAFRVLNMQDEGAGQYIEYSMKHPLAAGGANTTGAAGSVNTAGQAGSAADGATKAAVNAVGIGAGNEADVLEAIRAAIINGSKAAVSGLTIDALKSNTVMEVINRAFIPALDRVGELYEKGTIFLPQLMNSSETARRGFDVIKQSAPAGENTGRLTILLATVKGDIHDIGKNIVRMLLENYGYRVIDLGKDVEPALIVETIKRENIRLVGLSALMTTTVKNMKETIDVIRAEGLDCRIVVGGAVLNAEYAAAVGADYYAADAAETARIAAEVEKTCEAR